jgi:hypothetical protein
LSTGTSKTFEYNAKDFAMTISGHKTRSVFDRYHIISDEDLKEAAKKQQAFHEKKKGQEVPNRSMEKLFPSLYGRREVRMEIRITISSDSVKMQAFFMSQEVCRLLKKLVPEVGIPSIDSGQAPRHGAEAPRDFETLSQRRVTQRNH